MHKIIVFIVTSLVLTILIGVYSAIVMSSKWSRIEEEAEKKKYIESKNDTLNEVHK